MFIPKRSDDWKQGRLSGLQSLWAYSRVLAKTDATIEQKHAMLLEMIDKKFREQEAETPPEPNNPDLSPQD
jgi:hypothetical protein